MVSTPQSPGREWRSGPPTATMSPVTDTLAGATQARPAARVRARRARLVLSRVDPWSVMKLAFLLSIALAIVAVVAVFVLWSVLDAMGVFDSVGSTAESVQSAVSRTAFTAERTIVMDSTLPSPT